LAACSVRCANTTTARLRAVVEGGQNAESVDIEEAAQLFRTAWVTQFAQCFGFDLANAFAGDVELLADFFQRVIGVHIDAETHA